MDKEKVGKIVFGEIKDPFGHLKNTTIKKEIKDNIEHVRPKYDRCPACRTILFKQDPMGLEVKEYFRIEALSPNDFEFTCKRCNYKWLESLTEGE